MKHFRLLLVSLLLFISVPMFSRDIYTGEELNPVADAVELNGISTVVGSNIVAYGILEAQTNVFSEMIFLSPGHYDILFVFSGQGSVSDNPSITVFDSTNSSTMYFPANASQLVSIDTPIDLAFQFYFSSLNGQCKYYIFN